MKIQKAFPSNLLRLVLAISFLSSVAVAKDAPFQVIDWPTTGTPVIRFTFAKLKQFGGVGSTRSYSLDTTAQNLSARLIPGAQFTIYLFGNNILDKIE